MISRRNVDSIPKIARFIVVLGAVVGVADAFQAEWVGATAETGPDRGPRRPDGGSENRTIAAPPVAKPNPVAFGGENPYLAGKVTLAEHG